MNGDLKATLAKCGLRDLDAPSFSRDCPLCQTSDGLEIKGFHEVTCHACEFIGDLIELYAAITKQSLPVALSDLQLKNCVEMDPGEAPFYLGERSKNRRLIDIWHKGQAEMREGPSGSIRATLSAHNCLYNDVEVRKLAKYFCQIRAEQFEGLSDEGLLAIDTCIGLRWMRKYTCLGMPCWERSRLVGMWVIQPQLPGGYQYVPFQDCESSVGLSHAVKWSARACVLTNDPVVALRFMARQCDSADPVIFLCPGYGNEAQATVYCAKKYYLPVSSGGPEWNRWYMRAHRANQALTIPEKRLKFIPATGWPEIQHTRSVEALINYILDLAMPAAQAIGDYLLGMPQHEAFKVAMLFNMMASEQLEVLSHFSGVDVKNLKEIFNTDAKVSKISLGDDIIVETSNGWVHNSKVISEAIIRLTEMRTDTITMESMVTGFVLWRNRQIPFQEKYSVLRRNTADWLDKLVRMNGGWATVNPRWSGRLLEIAKAFSDGKMKIITTDKPYGWSEEDGKLRFPRFIIDTHGIGRALVQVDGPDVPYPTELSPEEKDAFNNHDFCMVALALLGNLVRTSAHMPGQGIVVPASPHVIERIASVFNIPVVRDPPSTSVEANQYAPFPILTQWTDEALCGFLKTDQSKHCMLSVDQKTFRLMSASPDWVRLPVDSLVGYDSLRWVLLVLPGILAKADRQGLDWSGGGFYLTLAKMVAPGLGQKSKLVVAGQDLDNNWTVSSGSAATAFMRLLHWAVDAGLVKPEQTPEGYLVHHSQLTVALSSPFLPRPDLQRIKQALQDAGMLVSAKPDRFEIAALSWQLTKTYTKTVPL